jgi:hypothetical protein
MKTILKLLIPLLLISAVAGTPLSSAMLKYDKCPIPENVENPKDLSNYINTLSYDYEKAELVNSGVNTYQTKTNYPYKTIANKRGICGDFALLNYVVLKELGYNCKILEFVKDNGQGHAVCMFCENGTWKIIEHRTGIFNAEWYIDRNVDWGYCYSNEEYFKSFRFETFDEVK